MNCLRGEMDGISLDNPYGDVIIPRARLRTTSEDNSAAGDSSTIITNPLALNTTLYQSHNDRNSALNPYGNFHPHGSQVPHTMPVYTVDTKNPPPYELQMPSYTVKEDPEEVTRRCCASCRSCRRKK
ncbi:uncharacterized protein LOC136758733 [Amia ocellicauda]|uniref:uncharacterized protein LOC136758733 n=1 Tax=Amia ocellicauda TaxID=2972642 RepID=UPI0034643B16